MLPTGGAVAVTKRVFVEVRPALSVTVRVTL